MCLAAASVMRLAPNKGSRTSVIVLPGYQGCGKLRCSMVLSCRLVGDTTCFFGDTNEGLQEGSERTT